MIGIVGLAALVGIVILFGKAKDAASKAFAQKVVYKKKYEKGTHILKGFTFETTASSSAVMQQLEKRVVVADAPSGMITRLYVALRKPDRIDYVYGHKFGDSFRVAVVLESRDSRTIGVLKPVKWHEREGIIVAQEWLGTLLDQVRAAVRELDPEATFVEGVHDSVQLTVPAETSAPESAQVAPAPLAAPAAVATAAPTAPPASYSEHVAPIVPPTKANEAWQWVGIVTLAGAILWISVLGVRSSMMPVWFGVLAAGGAIVYFTDRAARMGRAPAAASGDEAPAEATPEPTLAERLATDESEPDPYAWAEPKVEAPGSAPVTLNSALAWIWNHAIGVALLGIGGWSLLTGELGIVPALFMLGGGVYFLASRSLEGRVAVFVHRLADVVAGWLLAQASALSSRLSAAGTTVKPVVLARVVLAIVLVGGLGYGFKGRPGALLALFVGITPFWVWPALEKRAAQGAMSPALPVRQAQPEAVAAAVRPATQLAAQALPEEPMFFEEEPSEPVAEPAPEDFDEPLEADTIAPAVRTDSSKLLARGVVVVSALVIVAIVGGALVNGISKAVAKADRTRAAEERNAAETATESEDGIDPSAESDAISPDSHARAEVDLFGSAPTDGTMQFVDVIYSGGSVDPDDSMLFLDFYLVSRDPAEWYQAVVPNDVGYYIDYEPVSEFDFIMSMDHVSDEYRAHGMIVFDDEAVYEAHIFTQGQKASASTPEKDQVTVVPEVTELDLPYYEWEYLDFDEAIEAHDAAVEDAFAEVGLVAVVERRGYSGGDGLPIQEPPAGSVVPVGTQVNITIFTVD